MAVTPHQFDLQRAARRGDGNGRRMRVELWDELIRTGETARAAASRYGTTDHDTPGWCFDRFGMSRTRLPDGRIICIAGEHEDYYDPDFFIYNDVIVIAPDGKIEIYGYFPEVFRPSDCHTGTLVGDAIYIIGCVGYMRDRGGSTPVYRLDLRTMKIRAVVTGGDEPGWISDHWAELDRDKRTIRIAGGRVMTTDAKGKEAFVRNTSVFHFDTVNEVWTRAEGEVPTLTPMRVELPLGWAPLKKHTNAKEIRDAIVRSVGPDHPLFCDDFWPVAQWKDFPQYYMLQMLGSNRYAICAEFDFVGRQDPPPDVQFYSAEAELLAAARAISDAQT
jgi:hypothetical protein